MSVSNAPRSDGRIPAARCGRLFALAMLLAGVAARVVADDGPMFRRLAGPAGGTGYDDGLGILAQFSSPNGIAVDAAGNAYVADAKNHTIRKIDPTGRVTTLAGLAGHPGFSDAKGGLARFYEPRDLALDPQGNLVVADSQNHLIRKVSPTGVVTTLAGTGASGSTDGPAGSASFGYVEGLGIRADGVIFIADTSNNKIRVLSSGIVSTLAGVDVGGFADGPGDVARFAHPRAIAVGADALYVADRDNCRVRKVTFQGDVSTLAGDGTWEHRDGPFATARFGTVEEIVLDGQGSLWVSDGWIRRIDMEGGFVLTVTGSAGLGIEDGPIATARFRDPAGLAVDAAGNVFVADSSADRIRKISASGLVSTVAGNWTYGFADGDGADALFDQPVGVVVGAGSVAYVPDWANSRIRRVDATGSVTTAAGDGTWGYREGPAAQARFAGPRGVALDAAGNLYVADMSNNRIRKVDAQGIVSTFAGTGVAGYLDGPRDLARFYGPRSVAVDADGNVYVGDAYNFRIRKIDPSGQVSTLAGDGTEGFVDGPGPSARFGMHTYLATDAAGNVIVADEFNCRIRKVAPNGTVSTIAGSIPCGHADGTGSGAKFYQPRGVAVDAAGDILVADSENHRIRRIDTDGAVTTVAGGVAASSAEGSGPAAGFANPVGIAEDPETGNLVVVDERNGTVLVGRPGLGDRATIDHSMAPSGYLRHLDALPRTATNWAWSVVRRPSGSLAELSSAVVPDPAFIPDVDDVWVFRLTARDDLGNASGSLVTLAAPPACTPPVVPVVSGGGRICEGGTASLFAGYVAGASYWWQGPNGFSSTDRVPVVGPMTLADSGSYSVVFVAGGCRSELATASFVVEAKPPFPVITGPATVEPGETFSVSVPDAPSTSWSWTVRYGVLSSGQGTNTIQVVAGETGSVVVEVEARSQPSLCFAGPATASIPIVGPSATGFYVLPPCRLLDTRISSGAQAAWPSLAAGETRTFSVDGRCGLSGLVVRSLAANLTVTGSPAAGEIVVFRGDLSDPPATSSLSWKAGATRANNALFELSRLFDGTFRVHNRSTAPVDLILDVSGVFR